MASMETLKARLAEAEEALHLLMVGQLEVSVGVAGRSVTFTTSNQEQLRAYISELKRQTGQSRRGGPIRPYF